MRIVPLLAVALLVPACGKPATDQAASLAWKLPDSFHVSLQVKTDNDLKAGQRAAKTGQDLDVGLDYRVVERQPDGGVVLEQEVKSVKVFKSREGQRLPDPGLEPLLNEKVRLHLAADKSLTKMEGVEELADKMGGGEQGKKLFIIVFRGFFELWAGEIFPPLPARPLQPGDTWDQTIRLQFPTLGTVVLSRTFKYEGNETHEGTKVARISFTGKADMEPPKEEGDLFGFRPEKVEVRKTSCAGKVLFDPASGLPVLIERQLDLDLLMGIKVPGKKSIEAAGTNAQSVKARFKK